VLLNLTRNSLRILEGRPDPEIRVTASQQGDWVFIRFQDNGPGVADPARLFQPFQSGADAVGLGLFVSRSIVRGCGGELYHEASERGCTMCIRLRSAESALNAAEAERSELHA
jgi:C4-dicarboxylate-specific signal transduction histidine kinase